MNFDVINEYRQEIDDACELIEKYPDKFQVKQAQLRTIRDACEQLIEQVDIVMDMMDGIAHNDHNESIRFNFGQF